jgi:hypothetical protein
VKRLLLAAVVLAAVSGSMTVGSAATLHVSSAKVDTFVDGQQATTTTTTAPTGPLAVVSREYFDVDADGRIDLIVVTYNRALGPYNGTNSSWTLVNRPAGMSQSPSGVSIEGSSVRLTFTTLSTAQTTWVDQFGLTLSTGTAVQDVNGVFAPAFTNQPLADRARPIPISLTMANGGQGATQGVPDRADTQTIVFSEPLAPGSICPGKSSSFTENTHDALTATLSPGTPNTLSYASTVSSVCGGALEVGSISLGAANYTSSPITFSGPGTNTTDVSWSSADRRLQMKLGQASSTASTNAGTAWVATYVPSPLMADLAGNPATGSVTFTGRQF